MTRVPPNRDGRDPLADVERVLVDGTNLLHRMARGPDRQPPAALIGRLRAVIPAETKIEIVFDGPPDRGTRGERIAHGVEVRFSGRWTADNVIVTLVEAASPGRPDPAAADRILVVTDDRDLGAAVRRRGARTAGSAWLIGRLDRSRLSAPSAGNRRPPTPPRVQQRPPGEEATEATPWGPGRGATTKKGNGRRAPRAPRRMPS